MKTNSSKARHWFWISNVLIMLSLLGIAGPGVRISGAFAAPAMEADALANDIDKGLRTAERDMFNGKNEAADQQLGEIAPKIEQLRAADPSHRKLTSFESKFARIRSTLDRKLGRTAATTSSSGPAAPPKPTPKAAATADTTPAPAAAESALPRAVQSDLANAKVKLDEAESKWAEESTGGHTVSGSTDPNAVKLEAVEQPLTSAKYYYGNILKKCERKSSPCEPSHPDIAAIQARIEAMEKNVAGLQAKIASAAEAGAAAAAAETAKAQAAEADCENWNQRMKVYTEGDKALYPCSAADDDAMPRCKDLYDEAVALMAEFKETPWAAEPCGALHSTLSDLNRYMDNFKPAYDGYVEKQAAAKANMGEIVFSKKPIDATNPADLTRQFAAGDHIYGLIRTTKPWAAIYGSDTGANVMVNVAVDGKKIHAQFVNLKTPALTGQKYLSFDIAPDPAKMTAYDDPNREYGKSTATMRQGPNELTQRLGELAPGKHTMAFDVTYYGTVWAAGSFTIEGGDFRKYAQLHEKIAESVAQSVTLPAAKMTNKKMVAEMETLLKNAGWEDIHRINIVDKDWWIDRISGGNSPVKSRHLAAAALAKDGDGYYYKVCTFHQDKLPTGAFGELYLSNQGDRVPIPKANIDK